MNTLERAEQFVKKMLVDELPTNRVFHNIEHTKSVVFAAKVMCNELEVSDEEKELVILAAWFHDTGHIHTSLGHEKESQKIASDFLMKNIFPEKKIERVNAIIGATQMPQSPSNLLEQIICDADLYHLSSTDYCVLQEKLKEELTLVLGKSYSAKEWQVLNIQFLKHHKYFTAYGQNVLSKKKEKNLKQCEKKLQMMEIKNK